MEDLNLKLELLRLRFKLQSVKNRLAECREEVIALRDCLSNCVAANDLACQVMDSAVPHTCGDEPKAVGALSADEHRNFIDDLKRIAARGGLPYAPGDFRQDFMKASNIEKHAKGERGIDSETAFLNLSNKAAETAESVLIRTYKKEVQYMLFNSAENCFVVVDRNNSIRNVSFHMEHGGLNKCLQGYRYKTSSLR